MTHHSDITADGLADRTCAVAHGAPEPAAATRTLVAVFASPVAEFLLHFGADCGFRAILLEPDAARAAEARAPGAEVTASFDDLRVLDPSADVVVTDHHRPELDAVLRDLLAGKARWIGVLGNLRHPAPYLPGLREMGVAQQDIDRVHRPVGLNIGSRTPPEIAVATLAGLIADRSGRPGGFAF